ncbi:sulfurtransferase [Arthrobacter cavernae]|uniref:Sulfurtransferase n=1 Tax=Arthrobacter cavernae TaxID=2817681 RepID=A0A939HEI3_9MICC|nr:sulfurtransferase [Arthrobacter cavernae]MBO1266898.1 sulfurtransferase [Arthrobacter cavernae]
MTTLLDATELRRRLESGGRTVVVDVRWTLGDPNGHAHYLEAHLPGAVYADLSTELADHAEPGRGRHPLPSKQKFQESARRWGLHDGDTVVAYDDSGNMAAARLWWMLRDAGVGSVYLLDGGLAAWRAAGYPVEAGEVVPAVGSITLGEGHMPVITEEETAAWPQHGTLLDARAGERYRGDVEPVDPRAGHIPGAVSAPTTENLSAGGRFLDPGQLRRRFAGLGLDPAGQVAVYCGSGVTASHEIAALEIAGYRAALFPGSFSQWSTNAANAVDTGDRPYAAGAPGDGTVPTGTRPTGTRAVPGSSVRA